MPDSSSILFLGNSYTFCHNLPFLIVQLAASATPVVAVHADMVVSGGKPLEWHCGNKPSLDAISSRTWDFIVLQEMSTRPVDEPEKMYSAGTQLDAAIRLAGSRTALFQTWARRHIPEMQNDINNAYAKLAELTGARVAPVGMAWQQALKADNSPALHDSDRSHPTAAGSYLAACVFCATLFGIQPAGLTRTFDTDPGKPTTVIDPKQAAELQNAAHNAVSAYSQPERAVLQ